MADERPPLRSTRGPRLAAAVEIGDAAPTVEQVWRLLGKADVIVRGCLQAQDPG